MVNNKDYSTNIPQHLNQSENSKTCELNILPSVQLKCFIIPLRQRSNEIINVSFEQHSDQNSTIDGSDWDKAFK